MKRNACILQSLEATADKLMVYLEVEKTPKEQLTSTLELIQDR